MASAWRRVICNSLGERPKWERKLVTEANQGGSARDFVRIVFNMLAVQLRRRKINLSLSLSCGDMRSVIALNIPSRFAYIFMNSAFPR